MTTFGLDGISRRTRAVSRSISAENFTGAKSGGGRATEGTGAVAASRLGPGWKISPSIDIAAGETAVLAGIEGPGTIRHLWCTTDPHMAWRGTLLRMYWEDEETPAVEVPLGDFFCNGWNTMMHDPLFWDSMKITGEYVVILVPVLFCVSLGLGLLVKQKLPGVGAYRTALFLPYVISLVVVGVLWKFLLDEQTGAVNRVMRAAGFDGKSWLGSPALALGCVIAIMVWVMMGYYMIIFLAGLQEIPKEFYEAAKLDGAGPWTTFRTITWPLLRPTSFFVLLMSTVAAITGGLDLIFVLTNGGPANGTSLAIFYIYQYTSNWNYTLAAATVVALPMLVLFFVFQRQIVESIKTSGLK
ncbi:carbohydrate ABC transporter permease [Streptomyces fodineus]|uniref:carbohydrate ABC transporter permease n=1 Tax=Streptomyces fodineus TaxID=1904616 RepID=UPI0009A106B9|nr:sugar ABC transporter permease [Streptomyces fodineus]